MIARALGAACFALGMAAVAAAGSARAETARIALVIGNADYEADDWALTTTPTDAAAVAGALADGGFDVDLVIDADGEALAAALSRLEDRLRGADGQPAAFVYYAGHAARTRGSLYLLPVDAREVRRDGVVLGAVLNAMATAGDGRGFVAIDACRPTPLIAEAPETYACAREPARGRGSPFILYAAGPGETPVDGAFSSALAAALRRPGLGAERAFEQVAREVAAATAGLQRPWIEAGARGEAFYFTAPSQADHAARVAEAVRWDRARRAGTAAGYGDYMAAYPHGRFVSDALWRIGMIAAASPRDGQSAAAPALSAAAQAERVEPPPAVVGLGKFRAPDPQDLLVLDTSRGRMVIEMLPELAPATVARVRELAREGHFDGAPFTRVVEGFLAELRLRPLSEPLGLPRELLAPASVTPTPIAPADLDRNRLGVYAEGDVAFGMYKGVAVAQRGGALPESWVSHCPGVVSRAPSEGGEGDSLVLMLGEAPSLDREGEPFGRVILGFEAAFELAAATPLDPTWADAVARARVASDLAPRERVELYAAFGAVLDETSPGFAEFTESLRASLGRAPRVCEFRLPNSATAVRPER